MTVPTDRYDGADPGRVATSATPSPATPGAPPFPTTWPARHAGSATPTGDVRPS